MLRKINLLIYFLNFLAYLYKFLTFLNNLSYLKSSVVFAMLRGSNVNVLGGEGANVYPVGGERGVNSSSEEDADSSSEVKSAGVF